MIRGSVDKEKLVECIEISLAEHYDGIKKQLPDCLEDLTMHDYVMLLRHGKSWPEFKEVFGGTAQLLSARLKDIPDLRNCVFHFKREITAEEYDRLRDCRDWLLTRIRRLDATKRRDENGQQ